MKTGKKFMNLSNYTIGGSEIATFAGCGFFTPLGLWERKIALWEFSGTEQMEWGNRLESAIFEKFNENHKPIKATQLGTTKFTNPKYPKFHATPDGEAEDLIIEVKNILLHNQWRKTPPLKYLLQVLHYARILEKSEIAFAVLFGGCQYKEFWYTTKKLTKLVTDENPNPVGEVYDEAYKKAQDFVTNNLENLKQPEPTTYDEVVQIDRKINRDIESSRNATDEEVALIKIICGAKAAATKSKKLIENLNMRMAENMLGNSMLFNPATGKIIAKKRIDNYIIFLKQ